MPATPSDPVAATIRVVVNDEPYLSERAVVNALAEMYRLDGRNRLVIAVLCDDYLDRRGRLLGLVRDEAIRLGR